MALSIYNTTCVFKILLYPRYRQKQKHFIISFVFHQVQLISLESAPVLSPLLVSFLNMIVPFNQKNIKYDVIRHMPS